MSDLSKDHFCEHHKPKRVLKTSFFFFLVCLCFVMPGQFVVYAHSRTVYQNTLNVLGFFHLVIDTLDCVDIVSSTCISFYIPHCVSHM